MSWLSRLANGLRRRGVDGVIDDEMAFHIESRAADLVAGGMSRDAAERLARQQFGSRLRIREQCLDIKLLPWLDSLARDVRLGVRMLRKNRLVTGAATVSLSLALGACMAAFSLVDALILRPLPVHQPERLIYLTFPSTNPDVPESDVFSDPAFVRLRDAGRGRVDLFAIAYPHKPRVTFDAASGERETVRAQFLSGDAFARLGVGSAVGRLLTTHDDNRPGAHPVAVLSHAFWMQRFGGDPGIVGRWFTLHRAKDDHQFRVVGVTAPGFAGLEPGYSTDVWLPYAMQDPATFGMSTYRALRVIGRLQDGVAAGQVQDVLQAAFTNFRRQDVTNALGPNAAPDRMAQFVDTPLHVRSAATGPSPLRSRFQRPLWLLAAIAALMLLIAGSNVANLFLARIAARDDEMSLRLSLGAGRGRLFQQLLIETAIVAGAACLIGVLFATVAAPGVVGLLRSTDDPVLLDFRLDWRFVAFISSMTLLSGVLLALAPALRVTRVEPMAALKATGTRTSVSARSMRPFVIVQVAFSLIVLFVGGLLVQSFARLSSVAPGFATSDVMLVSWEPAQRMEPAHQRAVLLEVLGRLRQIPGIAGVSAAEGGMLGRLGYDLPMPGRPSEILQANLARVTPGFFETMRIPLRVGRSFTHDDFAAERPLVVVVNDSFAKRYFGGQPALGRRLDLAWAGPQAPHEIVGIAADTRYDLRKPPAPTIYVLVPVQSFSTLQVRVAGDASALAGRIRDDIRAATPLLRVTSITSQATLVERTVVRERLLALLGGFFALVGLVLTAVGLYGTLSYAVVQRTREIGIRVALGARAAGAVRSVMADTALTTAIGAAGGLAGGLYAARFMDTLLFDVAPLDVASVALPLGTLLLAALAAAAVPAWRAARVDPVVALRNE